VAKVVAVVRDENALAGLSVEALYRPVDEGVTGRDVPVAAIAIARGAQEPFRETRAGIEAYLVEERPQWDRGRDVVVRFAFVRRRSALTHDEFAEHWTRVHAPLARRHHPVLVRYVQNVVLEAITPGAPEVDGIAELGFRTIHDVRHRMYDSPAGAEIIRRDIARFLDVPAGWRMLARRL
jgi:uncharacterized protein (TIGR02118 family)